MNTCSANFRLLLGLTLAPLPVAQAAEPASPAAARPNILLIAVDDLKPLLGVYGQPQVRSPHIDRMAARGAVFLNAACQFPVCGPSRASLLTGLRPEATGVLDLRTKMRDVRPEVVTLPQHFKQHGYATAGIGKIFDPRCVDSRQQGDAISWTVPYAENPAGGSTQVADGEKGAVTGSPDLPDEAFVDGRIAARGIEQLREFARGPAPFFLAVGFKKPHLPFIAPKRYWDLYDRNGLALAPFQEPAADHSGYGYWNSQEIRGYDGVPKEGPFAPALQRELIHGYLACISWVDELVGRLVAELERLQLDRNTLIVLWGDHGFHLGDHGLWGKHTAFEEAVRAPLIVVDPRVGQPRRVVSPVEFIDIFPTLCELAGLPRPEQLQGLSLAANLHDETRQVRRASTAIYKSRGAFGYSVRTTRYRYIEWIDTKDARTVGRDLFDFESDPTGRRNLASDPAHAGVVSELAGLLRADPAGWSLLQRQLSQP
jgi:arylsulfatase A-like enzyme